MTLESLPRLRLPVFLVLCALALVIPRSEADVVTAQQSMENPQNPLLQLNTSRGDIFIELLPNEAPNNVANIIALAQGEVEIIDTNTNTAFRPRYFDGIRFHRVVPGFIVQAGSPLHNPLGPPEEELMDEINARTLGLNTQPALNPDGSFNAILNIADHADFAEQILVPLYENLNIDSEAELLERQYSVLEELQQMTVQDVYENQGYRYLSDHPTRSIARGTVALANRGPDSNGPEFFIALQDSPWLNGKHTVIGIVVEGMEVVDTIGESAVDPLRTSRLSAVIYSVRRVN